MESRHEITSVDRSLNDSSFKGNHTNISVSRFDILLFIAIISITLCVVDYVRVANGLIDYIVLSMLGAAVLALVVSRLLLFEVALLAVFECVFITAAVETRTVFAKECFWTLFIVALVFATISGRSRGAEKPSIVGRYAVLLLASIVAIFVAVRSVDYHLTHRAFWGDSNPNANAALAGITLLLSVVVLRGAQKNMQQRKRWSIEFLFWRFAMSIVTLMTAVSLLGTCSRVAVVWVALGISIWSYRVRRRRWAWRIASSAITMFAAFAVIFSVVLVLHRGKSIVSLLEGSSLEWRIKGDVSSDLNRFRYSDVLYDFMGDGQRTWGQGFGLRGYRVDLAEGEDLHNAFLTTMSDCGFAGTFALLIICFGWPIIRWNLNSSNRHAKLRCVLVLGIYSTAAFFPGPLYGSHYLVIAIAAVVLTGDVVVFIKTIKPSINASKMFAQTAVPNSTPHTARGSI